MEPKDRIAELCNRATTEENPAVLKRIMDELKASLAEYIREARRMTLLHFDYFRKHEEFAPEPNPPKNEQVTKNDLIEDNEKDRNEVFSDQYKKKAS